MDNELISKYEISLRGNGSSENTIVRYIQVAYQFIGWHQNLLHKESFDPNEVSALDLQQWKKYLINEATFQRGNADPKKYAISSVNNSIIAIKNFLGSLHEMGIIRNDPSSKLKKQKVNTNIDSEPRWLERHERNKLIRAIEDENAEAKNRWKFTRNRAIVYVQLLAGLRVSEVVDAETDDVDFNSGYIFIRDGKGGKARRVEINKELRNALGDWMKQRGEVKTKKLFTSSRGENPLTKRGVEYLYESLSKKIGISDLTTHVPRHTLAHDLIQAGYTIQHVADILGHTNINYTRVYTRSSTAERREALESISALE